MDSSSGNGNGGHTSESAPPGVGDGDGGVDARTPFQRERDLLVTQISEVC